MHLPFHFVGNTPNSIFSTQDAAEFFFRTYQTFSYSVQLRMHFCPWQISVAKGKPVTCGPPLTEEATNARLLTTHTSSLKQARVQTQLAVVECLLELMFSGMDFVDILRCLTPKNLSEWCHFLLLQCSHLLPSSY